MLVLAKRLERQTILRVSGMAPQRSVGTTEPEVRGVVFEGAGEGSWYATRAPAKN